MNRRGPTVSMVVVSGTRRARKLGVDSMLAMRIGVGGVWGGRGDSSRARARESQLDDEAAAACL